MNLKEDISGKEFRIVGEAADSLSLPAYVVGGYVRDIFLRRHSKDVDFVAVGSGIELAREVARRLGKSGKVAVYANYGTAQVHCGETELEFVGARKESYRRESRNPIVENGTLDDDLSRRDFTINAMAVCLNRDSYGELVDPFNGLIDLHNGIIRTPLDPDITFSDDPLRMLRAIRFASQLDFRILPETFAAIRANAERISIISKERINDELNKILLSPVPSVGLRLLDASGLLQLIFPELMELKGVETKEGKGHKDNFAHTLQVVDNVSRLSDNLWLRWAALLHDIAKPRTKKFDSSTGWTFHNHNFIGEKMVPRIFRRMKLPLNDKMKYVAKLVGLHMRPQAAGDEDVTDRGIRRLSKDAGQDLEDLMLLAEADITSKNPEKVRRILENFKYVRRRLGEVSSKDDWREWENPINGNMIKALFGIPDCSLLGQLKEEIKKEIYCVPEKDNFDYAYGYLLQIAPSFGLKPAEGADKESIRGILNPRALKKSLEKKEHALPEEDGTDVV